LAGPERRSAERRKSESVRKPGRIIADMILLILFLMLLVPGAVGSIHLLSLVWSG